MLTDWRSSARHAFRQNPGLAGRTLHELLEIDLPPVARYTVLTSVDGEDSGSHPPLPDMIILAGPEDGPARAIVVEFLQGRDNETRHRWPLYAVLVWLAYRCPVDLLVFCPDELTAHWADRPVATSLNGYVCTPSVVVLEDLGPVIPERR